MTMPAERTVVQGHEPQKVGANILDNRESPAADVSTQQDVEPNRFKRKPETCQCQSNRTGRQQRRLRSLSSPILFYKRNEKNKRKEHSFSSERKWLHVFDPRRLRPRHVVGNPRLHCDRVEKPTPFEAVMKVLFRGKESDLQRTGKQRARDAQAVCG